MNSTDGVNKLPQPSPELLSRLGGAGRTALSPKAAAEDYVAIENRLAAQRQKPQPTPQLNSIFDELRGRLPK